MTQFHLTQSPLYYWISGTCCHELDLQFRTSFEIIRKNAFAREYLWLRHLSTLPEFSEKALATEDYDTLNTAAPPTPASSPFHLQPPEGVVLHPGDLVASQVQDPQVLQTPEHVGGDQVDEVAVEGQLQQLALAEESAGLQRRDAVVLEVEVVQAGQPSQVLEADLHDGVVLEEDGLVEDGGEKRKEADVKTDTEH